MESAKQILAAAANVAQSNSEAIDRHTVALDRVTQQVDRLTQNQQTIQTALDNLASLVVRMVEQAEADR